MKYELKNMYQIKSLYHLDKMKHLSSDAKLFTDRVGLKTFYIHQAHVIGRMFKADIYQLDIEVIETGYRFDIELHGTKFQEHIIQIPEVSMLPTLSAWIFKTPPSIHHPLYGLYADVDVRPFALISCQVVNCDYHLTIRTHKDEIINRCITVVDFWRNFQRSTMDSFYRSMKDTERMEQIKRDREHITEQERRMKDNVRHCIHTFPEFNDEKIKQSLKEIMFQSYPKCNSETKEENGKIIVRQAEKGPTVTVEIHTDEDRKRMIQHLQNMEIKRASL